MGNTAQGPSQWSSGDLMSNVGMDRLIGFEKSAKMIIKMNSIPPWFAKDLIQTNLRSQAELAARSPLRRIPVSDGLFHFSRCFDEDSDEIGRQAFFDECMELLNGHGVSASTQDRDDLYRIFDAMDLDRNRNLSLGEVAGGLTVFFKGTQDESISACFSMVDQNRNGCLSKAELQEYLKPFINAMTPIQAKQLRPLLLKRLSDDIYREMNLDMYGDITCDEMIAWIHKGNNVVDRTANLINEEIYPICLAEKNTRGRSAQGMGAQQRGVGARGVPPGAVPAAGPTGNYPGSYDRYGSSSFGQGRPNTSSYDYGGSYGRGPSMNSNDYGAYGRGGNSNDYGQYGRGGYPQSGAQGAYGRGAYGNANRAQRGTAGGSSWASMFQW